MTAGHPFVMPLRTSLPGSRRSWTTVSFTTPPAASSRSKATVQRVSARQVATVSTSKVGEALPDPLGAGRVRSDQVVPLDWPRRSVPVGLVGPAVGYSAASTSSAELTFSPGPGSTAIQATTPSSRMAA